MVRVYGVDLLPHLHLRVILTTSIRRSGIQLHASNVNKNALLAAGGMMTIVSMKRIAVFLFWAIINSLLSDLSAQQVTTGPVGNITQTRATLYGQFADGSTQKGFEYKYGTLPTLDAFATQLLTATSDPVVFTQGSKPWRTVSSQGWVESYYDLTSALLTSDFSTTVTFSKRTDVSFQYRVSSQEDMGKLQFVVDGNIVLNVSGEKTGAFATMIEAGKHTLKWQYVRTSVESVGDGVGQIRNLEMHNTTPGEWIDCSMSPEARLSNLYPGQNYLYRAYGTVNGYKVYGSVRQFRTLGISIGTPRVVNTTQTTATVECDVDAGDAAVEAGFYKYAGEYLKTTSSSGGSGAGSGSGLGTNSFRINAPRRALTVSTIEDAFYDKNSSCKPEISYNSTYWKFSTSGYVYNTTKTNNQYLTVTFTLTEACTISFDYQVSGGRINYVEDGTTIACNATDEYKTVTRLLPAGTHTINWGSYYTGTSYSAYIKNVNIGSDFKIPIAIANGKISYTFTGLNPNATSSAQPYLIPTYSSTLEEKWPVNDSELVSFTTKAITATTAPAINLRQTTATIRGEAVYGDAEAVSRGLEYKISAGSTWVKAVVEERGDSLFADLTKLQPSSKYDYRSYIQLIGNEIIYSETANFTTTDIRALQPQVVSTTQTTAKLQGSVDYGEARIYSCGMQIKKAEASEWTTKEFTGEEQTFTFDFTNLDVETSYTARTFVERTGGFSYSEELTFSTKGIELYIDSITDVHQRSAIVHGRIIRGDAPPLESKKINIFKTTEVYKGKEFDDTYSLYLYGTTDILSSEERFAQEVQLQPGYIFGFGLQTKINGKVFVMDTPKINVPTVEINNPNFIKSLTKIEASQYCQVVSKDSYWNSYSNYVQCSRSSASLGYNMPLSISFELKEATTISFEWSVDGYHKGISAQRTGQETKYYYLYSRMSCYIDGTLKGTLTDNGTNKGLLTETLSAGKHTISWQTTAYGSFVGKIWNLEIPRNAVVLITDEEKICFTPTFFESVSSNSVTQTTTTLQANVVPTNETGVKYKFIQNISYSYEELERLFNALSESEKIAYKTDEWWDEETGEIHYVYDIESWAAATGVYENETPATLLDNMIYANLSGLLPNTSYTYYAVAKTADGQEYKEAIEFKTLPVGVNISSSNVTQTSARVNVYTEAGTATITNLSYRIDYGEWKSLSGNSIDLTGLTPDRSYRVDLQWTVSGETFNNYIMVQTASVKVYAGTVTPLQTSALVKMGTISAGTTTKTASGIIFNNTIYSLNPNGTVRLTGLTPNTKCTYTYFVDTKEGGRVSGTGSFSTLPITAQTSAVVKNISNSSATLSGTIVCDSYSGAQFGFQWKKKQGWTTAPRFTQGRLDDDGSIVLTLVNGMLDADTEYEFRAAVRYGKNADETDFFYYGDWKDFRTEREFILYPATAYTLYRTDSENNSIVLCGYYVAGSEVVEQQGYEYWLTKAKTNSSFKRAKSVGEITRVLTDDTMFGTIDTSELADGVYSLRAFVETSSGTIYGNTLTFNVGTTTGIDNLVTTGNPRCIAGKGFIRVLYADGLSLQVWSSAGQMVTSLMSCKEDERINLPSGVFIVKISNGQTFKIHVQ